MKPKVVSCLFILSFIGCFIENIAFLVKDIEEGKLIAANKQNATNYFEIYCYKGRLKHILHMWETVQLEISLDPNEFSLFDGRNVNEVSFKYEQHQTTWQFNIFPKRRFLKLDPFNQTCIGVVSNRKHDVELHMIRVDYWRILQCLSGFALFLSAPTLSTNSLFYYLTGVSLGVLASVLIVVFYASKLMPRKSMMYSFMIGGWAIGVYLVELLCENVRVIVMQYRTYVFYYIFGTALVSFMVCYRYGPVSDPRSINLIRWTLQITGLLLILFSSDFQEASLLLNILLLLHYNLPLRKCWYFIYNKLKWRFPVKRTLLSEDEYRQQGFIETNKAMDELREYCSSPECNQWKTILKLKNPIRFAKFVEGSPHLSDEEVSIFERSNAKISADSLLFTDDSSSD